MFLFGQNDPVIQKKLEAKYGHANYSSEGHFYTVYDQDANFYGACDVKGKEIIPMMWKFLQYYEELWGPFILVYDGSVGEAGTHEGLYTLKGKLVLRCEYESILYRDGFIHFRKDGKDGIANSNGKIILEPEWVLVTPYADAKVFEVCNGTKGKFDTYKYGAYNFEGKEIVPCIYNSLEVDTSGFIRVAYSRTSNENTKWGFFNVNGEKIVAETDYDHIYNYSDGLFRCTKDGKYGYLDVKGTLVIPCTYTIADDFRDGVAQVSLNGVSSLITNPLHGTKLQLANGGANIKVDTNIPATGKNAENSFAFIIANENYNNFSGADYSINDGKIFKEYCVKTLGLSDKNIHYYEDATFGNISSAVNRLKDIADVYEGDAKIIFYYSGLGISDATHESYILPVDATPDALSTTAYKVSELINTLNALQTTATIVILDSPFSGTDKNGKMLAQHRGVQISPKTLIAKGNTMICISSDKTETARSNKKYGHSLFTYAILYKLQASQGDCTIKDVMDYAKSWTKKTVLSEFNSKQSPVILVSDNNSILWNGLKW